jgi:hypothetical protein
MPELCRFYGIVIKMYFGDHNPPHFHAVYAEYQAVFTIDTAAVIEGNLPPRAHGLVAEWASTRKPSFIEHGRGFEYGIG